MEVDGIGQIARVHGRGVADLAVSTVARLLRRYARSTDLVARLEEAEFAAATPETDVKHAVVGVDRLRARVALQVLDFGGATAHVTCSAGVVELTADVADAEDMLRRAREALAQAKAQGGDCVLPPPPGDAELVET
jgi:diguanylate cyclase (GGDEF)-like protein